MIGNVIFSQVSVDGEVGAWGVDELEGSWVVESAFDSDYLSLKAGGSVELGGSNIINGGLEAGSDAVLSTSIVNFDNVAEFAGGGSEGGVKADFDVIERLGQFESEAFAVELISARKRKVWGQTH